MSSLDWFGKWFDSPYYHKLYRNRDEQEAQFFIDQLREKKYLKESDKILDVACGKGRHAIYLNQKGFDVTGIDLSRSNIDFAKQFENKNLRFEKWDMRIPYKTSSFDVVLNFFTSIGYFESLEENKQALFNMSVSLKKGGKLFLDFLNPYLVLNALVSSEEKIIDGIIFKISRKLENDVILKEIQIIDEEENFIFQERVKVIRDDEFLTYFEDAGLKLISRLGNYDLEPYVQESSERLIYIVEKI